MGDKIDYNKLNGETNAALTVTKEGGSKEYFTHCIKLLNDFKMMKDVIIQSDVRDVPILIKVAQNNLTKSAIAISDTMIKESQVDFNSKNVQIFIEKTISLITSVETADYLFGKMIDSTELRKYISVRTTNLVIKRSDKLLKLIKTTNFEDKAKLNIIIDNLNLCNKLLQYCWDISPSNIKALQQINKIIDKMIYHKLKLCLDNYNIEILNQMIENNKEKIEKAINGTNNKTTTSTSYRENNSTSKYTKGNDNIIASDTVLSEIDFEGNSTETALVQSNNSATDKFIEMTNEVIKDVSEEASGDFLSIALQRFYSIIGSIETLNYLKGNVVDKRAITNNISNLLTDMIYTNYTTITKSWNDIPGKTTEDYATYEKEVNQYIDILTEAYNMCNDNIDALKRCVEIQNNLLLMKDEFKFSLGKQAKLEYSINSNLVTIHKVDPDFKVAGPNQPKVEKKKKKSFWSKIFN